MGNFGTVSCFHFAALLSLLVLGTLRTGRNLPFSKLSKQTGLIEEEMMLLADLELLLTFDLSLIWGGLICNTPQFVGCKRPGPYVKVHI